MSYAWYKFHKAVRSLTVAHSQKKAWLASDYVCRIILLRPEDLPGEIQAEFLDFQRDLTTCPADSLTSSLRATVKAMDQAEVIKMILRLIRMYEVFKAHVQPFDMQFKVPANGEMREQAA
jgi:hypothetical protein